MLSTNMVTEYIPAKFAARFAHYLASWSGGLEDQDIELCFPHILLRCSLLPQARGLSLEAFLKSKADYLLLVDCDQTWPPNAISKLVAHDLPIVSALVFGTNPPFYPSWRNWSEEQQALVAHEGALPYQQILEVDAVGAGFCLIRRDVAEAVPLDAFTPMPAVECDWNSVGEDLAFCYRAKQAGFSCHVDLTCEVGHLATLPAGRAQFEEFLSRKQER